jgi:hypothetical protein
MADKLDEFVKATQAMPQGTSGEASPKKPSITSLYRAAQGDNPAVTNKVYRESHEVKEKPACTLKLITNSRIYGTRGSGGSRLAKSAIRLAIDTGVKSPSTFESSSLKSKPRVKTNVVNDLPADKAVEILNNFESKFGSKATTEYRQNMLAYKQAKRDELTKLGISTSADGRPLFKDEASQAAYFNDMEALSFSYYEVYLSVQPKGGRATRSKSFRAMSVEELRILFPNYKFEI